MNEEIEDFISLFEYLDHILTFAKKDPVLETLKKAAPILSEIYTKAWSLPIGEYYDIEHFEFEQENFFTKDQVIDTFLDYQIDLQEITRLLKKILDLITDIDPYFYGGEVSPDIITGKVFEWKENFFENDGWGEAILKVLLLINRAISRIR